VIQMEGSSLRRGKVHCSDIIRCPASHYLICQAYSEGKLCFEVAGKPCCKRNDPRRCFKCWVFVEYHLRAGLPLPEEGNEE